MKKLYVFMAILIALVFTVCGRHSGSDTNTNSGDPGYHNYRIAFYNVENLFDTIDNPLTIDEDFLPTGNLAWNSARFDKKIERIGEVMKMIDPDLPLMIGMCEIENREVLESLVESRLLKPARYEILHHDSPDERGIDVALLYQPSVMKLVSVEFIKVALPDSVDPNTREILHAEFKIGKDQMHVMVNHWPSRNGGQVKTQPNRLAAAGTLKARMEEILKENPDSKILVMGDFNDHPTDRSIAEVLHAGPSKPSSLFNYMYSIDAGGEGTYWYKGEWGALDQFIGTWNLQESTSSIRISASSAHILKADTLLFIDDKGVARPDRTFAGESYKGGFSDHLPVYLEMEVKK